MPAALALQRDADLRLDAALSEFLAECRLRQLSPTTLQWYQYALGPFVRFAEARGGGEVNSVTPKTVRSFLAQQAERVQARRVNHYREGIDRFFRWLVEEGYAEGNPAAGIPKAREAKKLVGALNEAEVQALLAEPDTGRFIGLRDYVFMLLLLDTGVRLSEALGLRVGDLNFTDCTCKVLGKGNKERVVGFSAVLERHLRRYLVRREAALAGIGAGAGPWVFPDHLGGKGRPKGVQMRLKQYAEAAGVDRVRVSPHTFRHTFALWFVRNGGSPFHLQKILGHTSLDMSRRYCELADVDFISRQQQLSPLVTHDLASPGRRRLR